MNSIIKNIIGSLSVIVIATTSTYIYNIKSKLDSRIDSNSSISKKSYSILLKRIKRDYSELVSKIDIYKITMIDMNATISLNTNENIYLLAQLNLEKSELEESIKFLNEVTNSKK